MPGGFHPFHAGHMALYNSARQAFPNADLYVAATNSQEERPFPFAVKEKLAKVAGVEPGHFIQVKSPFQAKEITQNYNPEQDVLIFVRSEKDRNESPKPGGTKKDGSPAYFQPWTGKDVQPFGKHAYFAYLPTVKFGPGITSATEIRKAWPTLNDKRKTAMVMSLYPAAQKNSKLAANIVAMLDQVMGGQEGLAEGSNDTIYPNAEVIKSKNGKPVGEIYQDGNSWGAFHYRADRGYDFIDSREEAIEALKDLHQETGRSRPDYTIKGVAEGDRPGMKDGRPYSDPLRRHPGNDSYMTPEYLIQKYQDELKKIAAGPYKRTKDVAMYKARIAKLQRQQGVAEGSQSKDDLIWTLNNFDYYTDNGNVYVNDNGDKIARIGSNWKHQSGKMGSGAEELSVFLSSLQDVNEGFGINYPGTYEQENNMFKGHGQRRIGDLTNETSLSESLDYLEEK